MHKLDLSLVRSQFPALQETDEFGRPFAYLDGPGGTQVPQRVIDAMAAYFRQANANHGGHFVTSRRNDEMMEQSRGAMADFLNASSSQEIVFGANMTTLTFSFSRAFGRTMNPGDEVIVTRLDHDANIAPWVALQEQGVKVKRADFSPDDCRLDLNQLASLLTDKTKLVAVGYASNAVGTINPIDRIASMAHRVGALLWVDAVHYAPHRAIDVQSLGCDFLVCSAYKFFGPHVGVVWGRLDLLEQLPAYKVRPSDPRPPGKFETGTQNHEGIAGIKACLDYLAEIGRNYGLDSSPASAGNSDVCQGRPRELKQAMQAIAAYEKYLFAYMVSQLEDIPGLKIHGIANPQEFEERCPTLAFTLEGFTPREVAVFLGNQGIFVWNGNFYALSVTERLGLEKSGGLVRVGLTHYNTKPEVDRLVETLRTLTEGV